MAIALIIQDDNGAIQIIGSKNVHSSTVEMQQDGPSWGGFAPTVRSFHIEAECADLTWHYRAQAVAPPLIEQRGIYLPDMSFRALPDNED